MTVPGELLDDPTWALAFRTLEPAPRPASQNRLLVLLHGFGSDEGELAALGARVGPHTRVVLPRAPRTVSGGRFGWFRLGFDDDGPVIVAEEAEQSRLKLLAFIEQLQARHDIAPDRCVLAGFSQGGVLAASAALTAPTQVGGFAVLCGRILPEIDPLLGDRTAIARLEALLLHGRRDGTLAPRWAERAHRQLDTLGVAHLLRWHDAGHELTAPMQDDFLSWLDEPARRFNRAPQRS